MSRPQKNTVSYFPLDCESGKKMFYIEETYGNDGFATFIKLLQELARSEYHYLNLSKNTTIMFLSARCKVSKETLLSIIESLVDLGKFDEELWSENKIIWCEDFVLSIQDAYLKRKNNCIDRKSLLQLLDSLGVRKLLKSSSKQGLCIENDTNNTQTILDNNKVNKTKFNFKEKILEFVDNETLVSDYIDMRKLKKASLSKTVFDSILKECNDNNFEVSEALKICLEKNWIGFKYEWVKNINKNNDTNGKQFSNQKSAYVFDIDRIIEANVSRNQ